MATLRLPDGTSPVVVSADTPALLRAEGASLADYLTRAPHVSPDQLSRMLFRSRPVRRFRALVSARDAAALVEGLRAVATGTDHPAVVRSDGPARRSRIALVFPGQGGQRPGMGALYHRHSAAFAAEVERLHAVFEEVAGCSPRSYLLDDDPDRDTSADDTAALIQPALFMQMAALAAMWRSFGVVPEIVVGHSQGEIAACYVAGVMDLHDAITVLTTRARSVDTTASQQYSMAVLDTDRAEAESLLARRSGWAEISVINSPRMTGVSGDTPIITSVVDQLAEAGRFSRVIAVRYPAHTAVMHEVARTILDATGERLSDKGFTATPITCIGSTLGEEITPDLPLGEYWFWNLRNVVRFDKAVARAVALGANTFVELSEHPTLQLPIGETLESIADATATVVGTSRRQAEDMSVIARNLVLIAVGDLDFDWTSLLVEDDTARGSAALPLPDFPHTITNDSFLWMTYATNRPEVSPPHAGTSAPATPAAVPDPTMTVAQRWVRIPRRSMVAPQTMGIVDLGALPGLADAIVEHAPDFGAAARRIDVAAESSDDATLLDGVDTVVVLGPAGAREPRADARTREAIGQAADFFGERRWWSAADPSRDHWLVTVGGEAVTDNESPEIGAAGIAAGFRCLGAEYPNASFGHLDLDPALLETGTVDAAVADKIVAALHIAREPDIALRGKDLFVKRLTPADDTATAETPAAGRHVLITGGTGKVGLEFADHFAAQGVTRLTLVSRRGATPEVQRRLDALRRNGTEVVVQRCDITDDAQVRALGESLADAPVDVAIHAAADLPPGTGGIGLEDITGDVVSRLCDAKVAGVHRILGAVPTSDDVRVLLCSSFAATIGGRGTIVYSAANRMLDAVATALRADGVDCASVQWGQWAVHDGSGAADAATLAAVGYRTMPSESAIRAGLAVRHNAIVAAFDWQRGHEVLRDFGYGPLLSDLASAEPAPPRPSTRPAADSTPGPAAPQPVRDLRTAALAVVADVIGAADVDAIDTTRPLVALGLDSLQALDLRRKVTEQFGYELPVTELVGGASLDDVIALLEQHAATPVSTESNSSEPTWPTTGPATTAPTVSPGQRIPALVAEVIGATDVDAIDTTRPLVALGLDSLQALDLRRKVTEEFGYELPVTELVGGASLDDVIALLGDRAALTATAPSLAAAGPPPPKPAVGQPAPPPEAGTSLAERTETVAERLVPDTVDYRRVQAARVDIDRIGLDAMLRALRPAFTGADARSADEIAAGLGFAPRHHWLLRQWLLALETAGVLVRTAEDRYRIAQSVPPPEETDLEKVCAVMGYRPVLAEFLRGCNENLTALARDEMRVQELLFVGGGTDTAEAAYRENLVSAYLNRAARAAVVDLTGTIGARRQPVRILELGAGVGGTTTDVVDGLAELSVPLDYHFTDVSEFFLSAAREHYAGFGWMRYGLLDMNADLRALSASSARYDIVIASNVLHNAHHIGRTLTELHDLLDPGGAVVIIESTHAYAQLLTSVQFLMSPAVGQPHAGADDVRAGRRIFLTDDEWTDELRAAGLRPAVTLPRPGHPLTLLEQRLFVAIKE
ncbi:nocobactin polyketide synthase NbtC [Gordonia bronchialis]|uniref:nocobactin polyketide synthase NbtC n=1 Tax=Gordonia bronchialis TaxID=2054 RepID=UPI00226F3688|nr:nocobactin polyketide synthase NbtC [Gordonia bronchialis]